MNHLTQMIFGNLRYINGNSRLPKAKKIQRDCMCYLQVYK